MHTSKLLVFIQTLSTEELKSFGQFVQSPYFNSNKKVVQLYQYIRKSAPNFEAKRLERQKAFKHLFPGQAFKEIKLQQLMSEIVKLLEKFWVQEDFKQATTQQQLLLTKNFRQKKLNPYWEKNQQALATLLQEKNKNNKVGDTHYYQFQLAVELHENIETAEQRNKEPNLQNVSDNLDQYYFINKLKYYCKALNYQRFKSVNYDFTLIEEVLQEVAKGQTKTGEKWLDNPTIAIYYYGVQTLLKPQNEETATIHFKPLKQLLKKHAPYFPRQEIQNMFVLARNFCIKQINSGNRNYLAEVFDLYKIEIDQKLILEEGKLSASTYKNITTVALSLEKFVWLEAFIYDYKWAVNTDTFNFTLAQLRFAQKKYVEVLQLLQDADCEEILLLLANKALLLKTYFELSLDPQNEFIYEDKLENFLVSFTTFLHRKKDTLPKHYIFYLNFAKMVKDMIKATHYNVEKDMSKLQVLSKKLTSITKMTEKPWLRKKMKELMGE